MVRATPGLMVLRPADANEVVEAWKVAMQLQHEPALLVLTRQALPTIDRTKFAPAAGLARGAYVLADATGGKPDVLLLATGSEVYLCVDAFERLSKEGIQARVVSMPSWELFERTGSTGLPGFRPATRGEAVSPSRLGHDIRMVALRWSVSGLHPGWQDGIPVGPDPVFRNSSQDGMLTTRAWIPSFESRSNASTQR